MSGNWVEGDRDWSIPIYIVLTFEIYNILPNKGKIKIIKDENISNLKIEWKQKEKNPNCISNR